MSSVRISFPFAKLGELAFQNARTSAAKLKAEKKFRVVLAKEAANAAKVRAVNLKEKAKNIKKEKKEAMIIAKENRLLLANFAVNLKEKAKNIKKEKKEAMIIAKENRLLLANLKKEDNVKSFIVLAKKVDKLNKKKEETKAIFLNARADVPEDLWHILDNKKTNNKKWLANNVGNAIHKELIEKHNIARIASNRVEKNLNKKVEVLEGMRIDIINDEKCKELPRLLGMNN